MKYAIAAGIVAIMAFSSLPAQADQLDFSKMTCSQFLALSKDQIGTTMIWLEGFFTTQDSPPILDTDKITTDGTNLGTYCAKNPDSGFIDAADAVVKDQG
jgi:acid stress chaperone HdeB